MRSKRQLRSEIRGRGAGLTAEELARRGDMIQRRIVESAHFSAAKSIASYIAGPGEVPTDIINSATWRQGKRLAVPCSTLGGGEYRFAWITAETQMARAKFGIDEPSRPVEAEIEEIDLIVVPGLAFTSAGDRLGRGAGIYDRMLSQYTRTKIGAAYAFQICDRLQICGHDVAMDYIFTEKNIFERKQATEKNGSDIPRRN